MSTTHRSPYYLGIDPGASGGLAIIDSRPEVVSMTKMPPTEADILEWVDNEHIALVIDTYTGRKVFAAIELVHAMPKNGSVSAFKLGRSYGSLLMALAATELPHEEVAPGTWKRALGLIAPKGSTDTQKKNMAKRKAQQLFPAVRVTHATADALLIAEWLRRTRGRME